jgi:hypothetical protein
LYLTGTPDLPLQIAEKNPLVTMFSCETLAPKSTRKTKDGLTGSLFHSKTESAFNNAELRCRPGYAFCVKKPQIDLVLFYFSDYAIQIYAKGSNPLVSGRNPGCGGYGTTNRPETLVRERSRCEETRREQGGRYTQTIAEHST